MWWKTGFKVLEKWSRYASIPLLGGLIYTSGQIWGGLSDLSYIKSNMATKDQFGAVEKSVTGLDSKVASLNVTTELIKAKINDEIIPHRNMDPKVKPLAGIPIQKAITLGELRYNWAIPYKARGGESLASILNAARVPEEPDKVKEVVAANPHGFNVKLMAYTSLGDIKAVRGAQIIIPVSDSYMQKYIAQTLEFKEGMKLR